MKSCNESKWKEKKLKQIMREVKLKVGPKLKKWKKKNDTEGRKEKGWETIHMSVLS